MRKINIIAPLPFIHLLSDTYIMYLKRSDFLMKIYDFENENIV